MTLPIAPAEVSGSRRKTGAARRMDKGNLDGSYGANPYHYQHDATQCNSGDWLLQQIIGLEASALGDAEQSLDNLLRNPKQATSYDDLGLTAQRWSPRKKRLVASKLSRSLRSASGGETFPGTITIPDSGNVRKRRERDADEDSEYIHDDDMLSVGDSSYYSGCSGGHLLGNDNFLGQSHFLHTYKTDSTYPESVLDMSDADDKSGASSSLCGGSGATGDAKQVETTEILKTWFFEHIKNPYPTTEEKKMLRGMTGMTSTQIRNWFTNFRKRHWNPIRAGREPKSYVDFILFKRLLELGVPGLHGDPPSFQQLAAKMQD
ncbi:Homeobox protein CUP9 [Hondaea fermentalgiana]|uniref:Homeobox protein CUP9 n=1 Tax=Hondaea fermentalgiana TaxID=2315210 RepID=A0A2R5GK00_9STRA|nr:Homeobox protein CUP9 [Hondaea fermentalgiana]|eukprot:GBG30955.1 Homeobox protein CUP9 [Hondaea fermentalgiana]